MLLFKDLKPNYPVFILNTKDVEFTQAKVVSVSFPHFDTNNQVSVIGHGNAQMVVDITLEVGDKTVTYVIPENLSITRTGNNNMVLATEKEGIIREIEALKASSEQIISSIEYHKGVIEKSDKLLAEFDPVVKEKQQNEQRFKTIESSISEMKGMFEKLLDTIKTTNSNQ